MSNYRIFYLYFLHEYQAEFDKIISNDVGYISTKIIKFHSPMPFRLITMIEIKVFPYTQK